MKTIITTVFTSALTIGMLFPAVPAVAAGLTPAQVQAVTNLLTVFGVDSATMANVQAALTGAQVSASTTMSSAAITSDMIGQVHLGDRGEHVKYLQALLAADPSVYPQGLITGYFGAMTAQAVKLFQKKHGLQAVGFVGPQTLQRLESDLSDNPIATASSTASGICAIIPPGHLIAPGWLKHHRDGVSPIIPQCQNLPPGIAWKLGSGSTVPATTTPDTTAPVISSAAVGAIASTSATVSWITDEPATSAVYFGTTTPLSSASAGVSSSALVTSHTLVLSPLTASSTYYYMIESADASNNTATTSAASFVTLAN
ncbi:peptidoglycan-binding protein [Patescibacteria group bacterium]|nr:peptidoglycan-binding protein [Patescibacteria group bacterium]